MLQTPTSTHTHTPEVYSKYGVWQTVCWSTFDASALDVVCRQVRVAVWVFCVVRHGSCMMLDTAVPTLDTTDTLPARP